MIPEPMDALVSILQALKVPAIIVVIIIAIDRIVAWVHVARGGASFVVEASASVKDLVTTNTSLRARAIVHALLVQAIAVVVAYAVAALCYEFVQVGDWFKVDGEFMRHPNDFVLTTTGVFAGVAALSIILGVVFGGNAVSYILAAFEYYVAGMLGLCAVIVGVGLLLASLQLLGPEPNIGAVTPWLFGFLVIVTLGGGMFLAARMPIKKLRGLT